MPQDILILGGGPAGLSTALHLAKTAPDLIPRLLVLEKARYPRHKLCGGALTIDSEVILHRLGLDVTEIPHVDAAEAHFDFAGRGLNITFRNTHVLRMIRRDEFDAWLAAKVRLAGIDIREGVTVRKVEPGRESVLVQTDAATIEAAIVVGADGSNGITRRCILPAAPIHTARALEVLIPVSRDMAETSYPAPSLHARKPSEKGYAGGVLPSAYPFSETNSPPPILGEGSHRGAASSGDRKSLRHESQGGVGARTTHAANVAYFDFAPVPLGIAGYTWDFPTQVDGRPMRCWGIYDTNLLADGARPQLKQPLADEMKRHGADLESVEIQGHPIRLFSPRSELSVPRVILAGDAAGTDGIFGEGISIALGYGSVAAQAIRAAVARGDYTFSDYRRGVLLSPLGLALTLRTAITHIIYRLRWAWFQRSFWRSRLVAAISVRLVLNWAKRMR